MLATLFDFFETEHVEFRFFYVECRAYVANQVNNEPYEKMYWCEARPKTPHASRVILLCKSGGACKYPKHSTPEEAYYDAGTVEAVISSFAPRHA